MKLIYFCNLLIICCNSFTIQPTNSLLLKFNSHKQISPHRPYSLTLYQPKKNNNNFNLYKKSLLKIKKNENEDIDTYQYFFPLLAVDLIINFILIYYITNKL